MPSEQHFIVLGLPELPRQDHLVTGRQVVRPVREPCSAVPELAGRHAAILSQLVEPVELVV